MSPVACPRCREKETGLPHPAHTGRCGMPTGHLGVVSCYCTYSEPHTEEPQNPAAEPESLEPRSEREYGTLRDRCVHSPRCMTLDEHDDRIAGVKPRNEPRTEALDAEEEAALRWAVEKWPPEPRMRDRRSIVRLLATLDAARAEAARLPLDGELREELQREWDRIQPDKLPVMGDSELGSFWLHIGTVRAALAKGEPRE